MQAKFIARYVSVGRLMAPSLLSKAGTKVAFNPCQPGPEHLLRLDAHEVEMDHMRDAIIAELDRYEAQSRELRERNAAMEVARLGAALSNPLKDTLGQIAYRPVQTIRFPFIDLLHTAAYTLPTRGQAASATGRQLAHNSLNLWRPRQD